MTAAQWPITIEENAIWRRAFVWADGDGNPLNNTGWTAKMQFRREKDDPVSLLTLTQASGISLMGASGQVEMTVTKTQANLLVATVESGRYDLYLITSGGEPYRAVEGGFRCSKSVTDPVP